MRYCRRTRVVLPHQKPKKKEKTYRK